LNDTIKPARGVNPNPYYLVPAVKEPLISEQAKLKGISSGTVFCFDLETVSGKEYNIILYKRMSRIRIDLKTSR